MTDAIAAPYPPDTRAKGWRFELDYEKIDQSDTWGLAAEVPMAQPALLMIWLVSWREEPCGSLPNDENIIRAKCKVPQHVWAKCRGLLMRGWWLADDGRLYHDTVAKRVIEMLEYRRKEAERRAGNRAKTKDSGGSPGESPDGVPRDTDRDTSGVPDTGTGTGIEPKGSSKAPRKRAAPPESVPAETLIEAGFDGSTAAEFIAHKAKAKAPLTARAWADHLAEAAKAGWTPMHAAEKVMAKGWKGFEAKYVAADPKPNGHPPNGHHYGRADPGSTVAHNPQLEATQRLLRERTEQAAKATPPPASILALRSKRVAAT